MNIDLLLCLLAAVLATMTPAAESRASAAPKRHRDDREFGRMRRRLRGRPQQQKKSDEFDEEENVRELEGDVSMPLRESGFEISMPLTESEFELSIPLEETAFDLSMPTTSATEDGLAVRTAEEDGSGEDDESGGGGPVALRTGVQSGENKGAILASFLASMSFLVAATAGLFAKTRHEGMAERRRRRDEEAAANGRARVVSFAGEGGRGLVLI